MQWVSACLGGCPRGSTSARLYWCKTVPTTLSIYMAEAIAARSKTNRDDWRCSKSTDCRTSYLQSVLKTCICQSCAGGGVDHPLAHQHNLDIHWPRFSKNIPPWQTPPCTFLRLVLLHDVLTLSPCPRPLDLTTRHSARSEGCRRSRRSFEMKRSPPQCRDCSSLSSIAGPSSTCTSLAAGKKGFQKSFDFSTSSKGALATLCKISP